MASIRSVLSVTSRGGMGRSSRFVSNIADKSNRFFCSSSDIYTRLIQAPHSETKATLDSAMRTSRVSWDDVVSVLGSFSPVKTRLVLEWRLERLISDNETDGNQYSKLISLCAKIQNVSLAMRVFTSMEAKGIKPTTSVFNSLVRGCVSSSSSVVTALSLFEIMQFSERCKPDAETYDVFVSGFSNFGDVDKMLAWFEAKKAVGFSANLQNYESLVAGCVKVRNFVGADKFFEEMLACGLMPSACVLESLVEGICKQRNCDRLKGFLRFLMESGFEINANMIEKVVGLYLQLGKVDEMEELLGSLMEFNQVGEALSPLHSGIIRLYATLDRLDDVEYSVGRMLSQGMSFRSPGDVEKVISLYFRKEAYDRLELFLNHIKERYELTWSTYNLLAAGYKRAGLVQKLDLLIEDMKSAKS